jgi:26S proteasome regulatory subunit N2
MVQPQGQVADPLAGSLNLLEDDDKDVRGYALSHLLSIVPQFWPEISEKLELM